MTNLATITNTLTINGIDYTNAEGLVGNGLKYSLTNEKYGLVVGQGGLVVRGKNQNADNASFELTVFLNSILYRALETLYKAGTDFTIIHTVSSSDGTQSINKLDGCWVQKKGEMNFKTIYDESALATTFTGFASFYKEF